MRNIFANKPSLKHYSIVFGLGLASALALPPANFYLCLFAIIPVLLHKLAQQESTKKAFLTGWWFGFGHHIAGLYWVSISLLIEPEKFAWLIPFAVSIIPALAAVFIAVPCVIAHRYKDNNKFFVLTFCVTWVVFEFGREVFILPFPWNFIGYTFASNDFLPMAQIASFGYIYLLSFIALLLPSIFYIALKNRERVNIFYSLIALIVGLFGATFSYGVHKLNSHPTTYNENINLVLVQPNIKQQMKWNDELKKEHIEKLVKLSNSANPSTTSITIWPETALPDILLDATDLPKQVRDLNSDYLITGVVRYAESTSSYAFWNSIVTIKNGKNPRIDNVYDKNILVPFGEYIPLRSLVPDLVKVITAGGQDFESGDGISTSKVGAIPSFSPLVCYEIIFPRAVVDANNKPDWIVNVTNDAWFGNSSGPFQHLAMARIRAIEQGMPVVRVANTGISAVIDSQGRILKSAKLGTEAVIESKLPLPLSKL